MNIKDVHDHPFGKRGKRLRTEATNPYQTLENLHRCAACGFINDLDKDAKCPVCGSPQENVINTPNW